MPFYTIGDVAERCGINPVTLRAWQRRYGLLKPQRSEGGHRQFDEDDIKRIEEIKRWIKSGVPVGKVKALLEENEMAQHDGWLSLQEEMLSMLRRASAENLRIRVVEFGERFAVDDIIDHIFVPVRQRLGLEQTTARIMSSLLDGVLIEHAVMCLNACRSNADNKEALLLSWECEDRARLWLEAWRLAQQQWNIHVLAEPLDNPRPEMFPGQQIFVWTGKSPSKRQLEQLALWREQGYPISLHH
ncbi:helix-turn-helix-type transcriptional regulator [Citrobacter amalonaticus]|uniref:Helix-turn-helix-type transcriptional regulator n=1 Tax=Citrobacter amalonaticus TaxID=35703 RepID=A0A2S4S0Y5_CITAM|nr:MerR family transcriptional regulator [Citrobacter amalonaticus]POT55316.1 helix-turn-helix-type transcriptional regulator [Citrobacter amalonaticus]POT77077.1 helix-turn-helix-type transcriptional regulator [Citrobacter amalonaticus]POU67529.1 helix-turn-helix-type transcriptional regulator [Citrobacter amalonaticus]POV07134.1 helix-turn-helix-type transcriptional regulator [Citrobacter amalonaticus]